MKWKRAFGARVRRVHREKVLKMDRPFRAGGFLSLTAFQAEGCGIALTGDEYEVSVTSLPYCVIWHDTHSGDWLTAFATPFPAARNFPRKREQNNPCLA